MSGTDLADNVSSSSSVKCHLADDISFHKTVQIVKPEPKNIIGSSIPNSKKSHNKKSPTVKIKSKCKKISPKKPLKMKEFLDKIKAKRMSNNIVSDSEAKIQPFSQHSQDIPSKTIASIKAIEDQNIAKIDDFSGGFDVKIDCAPKISGKMGHISPNNPLKIRPNPPENMVNPRTYPGSFTENIHVIQLKF